MIAGLFVLATEFLWAERLLEFTKRHVSALDRLGRRPAAVAARAARVPTAAFAYGVLVVTLHLRACPVGCRGGCPSGDDRLAQSQAVLDNAGRLAQW